MKKSMLLVLCMVMGVCATQANDKIYLDDEELSMKSNSFYFHVGNNVWLKTDTIHRDSSGLYTFDANISKSHTSKDYEKHWKCPYCYRYWPIGTPCQNDDCPSKYK